MSFDSPTLQNGLGAVVCDLCDVQGAVTDVDAQANRLTVELGSDEGIKGKDHPYGVTAMEIYAKTGKLSDYVYEDPATGRLYAPDRKSVAARPDAPDTWVFAEAYPLPQHSRMMLSGPDSKALGPLGERISDWAEVQELDGHSCMVALKRKADVGRTVDDTKTLARIPDPHSVPVIARVRGKRT